MSSPDNYVLELSQQAQEDIVVILQYTRETYGEAQEERYYTILYEALRTVEDNPYLGHSRQDLSGEYRAFRVGRHVIAYEIQEKVVYVFRILHESMDFGQHLG